MEKFLLSHNPKELARQTPVAEITDEQVWEFLVTPVVKALLGPVVASKIVLTDQAMSVIPEDKVFNQNDHRLWGGQAGFVRFPYFHSLYTTRRGCPIIRRDGVKVEVFGWVGDLKKQRGQLIWKVALRDRRYDGDKSTNDCALEHFPYDDPKLNGNFFPGSQAVELYLFTYAPGSTIVSACGDQELQDFVAQPFAYVDRPELFLKLFNTAWKSNRAPGQWSEPIFDAGDLMEENFSKLCGAMGYDVMEVAASHYHVAMWCLNYGYSFTDSVQDKNIGALREGIAKLKASGTKIERRQESWVAVIQSLPAEHIPKHLYMGGAKWPQDNITLPNLWLWKPLNEKSKSLKPKLVE
jgi:hypothetical protein